MAAFIELVERRDTSRLDQVRSEGASTSRDHVRIDDIRGGYRVELGDAVCHERELLGEPKTLVPLDDAIREERSVTIQVARFGDGASFLPGSQLNDPLGCDCPALDQPVEMARVRPTLAPVIAREHR